MIYARIVSGGFILMLAFILSFTVPDLPGHVPMWKAVLTMLLVLALAIIGIVLLEGRGDKHNG